MYSKEIYMLLLTTKKKLKYIFILLLYMYTLIICVKMKFGVVIFFLSFNNLYRKNNSKKITRNSELVTIRNSIKTVKGSKI